MSINEIINEVTGAINEYAINFMDIAELIGEIMSDNDYELSNHAYKYQRGIVRRAHYKYPRKCRTIECTVDLKN